MDVGVALERGEEILEPVEGGGEAVLDRADSERDGEMYNFRLADHFARLRESMKMMRFTIPYNDDQLFEAVRTVIGGNELREDVHMHCVAYVGAPGLDATTQTGLYINPRKRPRVMEGNGLKCNVSSWTRTSDNAIPIRLKSGSNYQNGRLAILQSRADGYDQPILLNRHGKVAEGSGATFFMVRKGRIVTPTTSSDSPSAKVISLGLRPKSHSQANHSSHLSVSPIISASRSVYAPKARHAASSHRRPAV